MPSVQRHGLVVILRIPLVRNLRGAPASPVIEEAMAPAGPVPQAPAGKHDQPRPARRAQLSPSSSSPRQSALPERGAEPFLGGREGEASSTIDPA